MPEYQLINEKLLQVKINREEVFSKKGSMIAYTGQVNFQGALLSGGRLSEVAMRQATGEGLKLMKAMGSGEVLYAHHGLCITLVQLQGERLYIESDSVLAFDNRLRTGTEFLGNQGGVGAVVRGAMSGQGLFTTTLEGFGTCAVLSSGDLIELQVDSSKTVYVDPQAYIAHKGNLSTNIHTDVNWKNLIGQGSGESFQIKFSGHGSVYVQADER